MTDDVVMEHDPAAGCHECPLNVPDGHEDGHCLGGCAEQVTAYDPAPLACPLRRGSVVFRRTVDSARRARSAEESDRAWLAEQFGALTTSL